ncbi:hypothetical protein [Iningainema tapete]|uniref:Uncharacterized protein n=1 Tax=Iningainema tapete BLCC-T55 TaxID=2748662 RepID=A0A8J6XLD8_9CYAN|nr:hypothetical protein [Iningainema tapete]MBD2778464.1 hypothetical protein [Iningainema tapete BLCC-T55]
MNLTQKDFCFCTLALGKKYRLLAQQLAQDLANNVTDTFLVIYTDDTQDFSSYTNVLAYQHKQQGILNCYNDKRLVLAKALEKFNAAVFVDADTRILNNIPFAVQWKPGITAGHCENLIEHVTKYNPERLKPLKKVALKLNLPLDNTNYVGECLFVIARDEGRELEFFKQWGRIGRYLELRGIHGGEGNTIGLAAAKVGWNVNRDGWQAIRKITKHIGVSHQYNQETVWDKLKLRIGYHYRLNLARLMALKDFTFFLG